MSWNRHEYDKQSSCACGKDVVIKHCYREDDDWGRSREGCIGVDIKCSECKSKYHYDSITRHYWCPPWEGDGFYTTEYLVPNGMKIPNVITAKSYFGHTMKEDIVCCVTKEKLQDVIEDMKMNKFSTRVQMSESEIVVNICSKTLRTKSLNKIIPILQEILDSYEQYEWNPNTIALYKQQEAKRINQNEDIIVDVISKSYELHFS